MWCTAINWKGGITSGECLSTEARGIHPTKSSAASSSKDHSTVVTEVTTPEDRPTISVTWAPSVTSERSGAASSSGAGRASGGLLTEPGTESKEAPASESLPTEAGGKPKKRPNWMADLTTQEGEAAKNLQFPWAQVPMDYEVEFTSDQGDGEEHAIITNPWAPSKQVEGDFNWWNGPVDLGVYERRKYVQ